MRFEPPARPRRKPGLTPLIDVVFLLLVFFMLASRFDVEASLPLVVRAGESRPAPRADVLRVVVREDGRSEIDERIVAVDALVAAAARAEAEGRDVVVEPEPDAKLQAIVDALAAVARAGVSDVALERRGTP